MHEVLKLSLKLVCPFLAVEEIVAETSKWQPSNEVALRSALPSIY
jgi:hypothetical protein